MQFLSKDEKFYRDKASGNFIAVPSPSEEADYYLAHSSLGVLPSFCI